MIMNNSGDVYLITGGAGFIGTKLIKALKLKGVSNIYVYDNLLPQVHGNTTPDILSEVEFIRGDITDKAGVARAVEQSNPDYIIHLASETGTGQSMDLPHRYCEVNVSGTAILLEALREMDKTKPRHIVLSSSRSIYGEGAYLLEDGSISVGSVRDNINMNQGVYDIERINGLKASPIPTKEDLSPSPASVYASTKLMQEQLLAQLAPLANCTYSILRFQNVYGPGQSLNNPYTGVLSIFVDIVRKGGKLEIYEDGLITRDFVFVEDVVNALLASLEYKSYTMPVNIGSGKPTTILATAKTILRLMGRSESDLFISGNFRPGDVRYAVADIKCARENLLWTPNTSLEDGLRELIEWSQTT